MDPIKNPFSPGAGAPPPELVGRADVIRKATILFGRIKLGRAEKSLLLTGLRGVGKTVLLNDIERLASQDGYTTILIESHESKSLAALLVPPLRRFLFNLDKPSSLGGKVKRALAVLKSFVSAVKVKYGEIEVGLDIDAEQGSADSGDIEIDLPNLFLAVAEAAEEKGIPIAIFIDEIQYLEPSEISALIMALHKMQQRQLPLTMVAAGLPILPALVGESKSYAERLFQFPQIGPLSESDANKALQDPVRGAQVHFTNDALHEIYRLTKGYPYFLQEWGYQCWNHAEKKVIDLSLVLSTTPFVISSLDENFFASDLIASHQERNIIYVPWQSLDQRYINPVTLQPCWESLSRILGRCERI